MYVFHAYVQSSDNQPQALSLSYRLARDMPSRRAAAARLPPQRVSAALTACCSTSRTCSASGLSQPAVPVREAHPDTIEPPKTPAQRMREAGDLLRNLNHFLFLPCTCGMSIKLPPDFKKEHVHCPRCKRELRIPAGTAIAAGTLGEQLRQAADAIPVARAKGSPPPLPDQAQPPLKFERQGKGWSSVQCSCGNFMNIGPSFQLDRTSCRHCGRIIELV